jgi:hypothetical protein
MVEDDAGVRAMVRFVLEQAGFHSMIKFLSLDYGITVCWGDLIVEWQLRPCT